MTIDRAAGAGAPATPQLDAGILTHLDAWLIAQIGDPARRCRVRVAMLDICADDPDYYGALGWWQVYDHAHCDEITAEEP